MTERHRTGRGWSQTESRAETNGDGPGLPIVSVQGLHLQVAVVLVGTSSLAAAAVVKDFSLLQNSHKLKGRQAIGCSDVKEFTG